MVHLPTHRSGGGHYCGEYYDNYNDYYNYDDPHHDDTHNNNAVHNDRTRRVSADFHTFCETSPESRPVANMNLATSYALHCSKKRA